MQFSKYHLVYFKKKSLIIFCKSVSLSALNKVTVSSAYRKICILVVLNWNTSFIKILNKIGPRKEPWGTSADIGCVLEKSLLTLHL